MKEKNKSNNEHAYIRRHQLEADSNFRVTVQEKNITNNDINPLGTYKMMLGVQ